MHHERINAQNLKDREICEYIGDNMEGPNRENPSEGKQ